MRHLDTYQMCETLQNIHNTSLNRTEAKAGFKFPGLTHRKSRKILARQFRRRWNDTLACFSY